MFELFLDPTIWVALITLIAMELVLGIDNLVFVSILSNRLPEDQRASAQRLGIGLALVMRLALLSLAAYIVGLVTPIFTAFGHDFSWRDIVLIAGGLFLVWKSTAEIHHTLDGDDEEGESLDGKTVSYSAVITQILLLDIVFSIDSIITAVGMTSHLPVMIIAVIVAVLLMMLAAKPLSDFIAKNPTIVMLALGFLLMIGTTLIADGFGFHVPRGYIYAAMGFSAAVEALNMAARNARKRKRQMS